MIQNEQQLAVTQERIAFFQQILVDLRRTAHPEELPYVASGYRIEIEKMQKEVLDYLTRPAPRQNRPVTA